MATPVIFFGTPAFAVPFLDVLAKDSHYTVKLVVTQPPKPIKRSGAPTPTPIHEHAATLGIPVITPPSLKAMQVKKQLQETAAQVFVVVAYGSILPPDVLDVPPAGSVNVHFSLLPVYRGPAPIEQAILDEVAETGVTIMLIDAGLDTGPILSQRRVPITDTDTTRTLRESLTRIGCAELLSTLNKWLAGKIKPTPQDDTAASVTHLLTTDDGAIHWHTQTADQITRMIRALCIWPGVHTTWKKKRLKIAAALSDLSITSLQPGEVATIETNVCIGTKRGALVITRIQLEGRNEMDIASFIRGQPTFIGSVLE